MFFYNTFMEISLYPYKISGTIKSILKGIPFSFQYGRRQATVELLQEMGMEKESVCAKMQEKFQLSLKEAEQEMEKYWK